MNVTNLNSLLLEVKTTNLVSDGSTQHGGDAQKLVAMATLGIGSFISGMLPASLSERNRRRFPLTTSLLLCFGAGILLATALVHILPEARSQMNSNFAEISLCAGFFIIYFIDEFIHYFFGEAIQHQHHNHNHNQPTATTQPRNSNGTNSNNYGTNDERTPLLNENITTNVHAVAHGHGHGHSHAHCDDNVVADANARLCHTSHTEPCAQSMTGTLGLFVALSLHSAIEGIAIGVQNNPTKVYFLLGAVACHKFVMAFCLGLEIRSNAQTTLRSQFIGIFVFALGAVVGIGIGMLIVDVPASWTDITLPVIQALAGGTLFYVTVCEVIPREKARWHQNTARKAAGFAQFFAVVIGFTIMSLINFYIKDDDN